MIYRENDFTGEKLRANILHSRRVVIRETIAVVIYAARNKVISSVQGKSRPSLADAPALLLHYDEFYATLQAVKL